MSHTVQTPKTKDIEKMIAFHEAELAKLKAELEEWKPWKPKINRLYYFTDANGNANHEIWNDCDIDEARLKQGSVFPTYQLAEDEAKRRAIQKKLIDCAKGFKPDYKTLNQAKWYISYESDAPVMRYGESRKLTLGVTYFATVEEGLEAINAIGIDDLKFLLGIGT